MKDFSYGDGFYIGKSFDKVLEWLRRLRYGRFRSSVVFVFRVVKIKLRGNNNEKGFDLRDLRNFDKRGEWENVVR